MRRFVVVVTLTVVSALVSQWQPGPRTPRPAKTVAALIPPIFTSSGAAAPTQVSDDNGQNCAATPVTPNGKLALTMKGVKFVNTVNNSVEVLAPSTATLDFAQPNGTIVGAIANNVSLPEGTYVGMKITVGASLAVKGAISCLIGGVTKTFITSGSSSLTSPDSQGLAGSAVQSNYTINNGADVTSPTIAFTAPVTVDANTPKTFDVSFSPSLALQLWDVSTLNGHALGTDYKILPGGSGGGAGKPTKVE